MIGYDGLLIADLNGTLVDVDGPMGGLYVSGSTWEFIPGVLEAVQSLVRGANFKLVIVTDQPGACRDADTSSDDVYGFLLEVGDALLERSAASVDVFVCTHDEGDGCACRKPQVSAAVEKLVVSAGDSPVFVVGDSWKDVHLARNLGVGACKVGQFGYASTGVTPLPLELYEPDIWVPTFQQAVRVITGEGVG